MKTVLGVFALLLAAAAGAMAQGPMYDQVIVNLPYSVTLNDKTLPAGSYTIEEDRSTAKNYILHILGDNGMKLEATVQTIPALKNQTPEQTQVILDHVGNDYYFDKMWIQGKDYGYQFLKPDTLKSREKERRESASVSGRYVKGERGERMSYAADRAPVAAPIAGNRSMDRVEREVRHELVMLPYYGVFDNLAYKVDGSAVTLMGQVTRPTLKSDAEKVVKGIEGVERVTNDIEVLPLSPNDDRIRLAEYRAIYGDTTLNRYGLQAVPPIHIIVKNGNVTLEGVVASEADKNIAAIRAKGVPGLFGVTNNLRLET